MRFAAMPDHAAKRFRGRAMDCRAIAKATLNPEDAARLEEIASELDDEANKIDAQKRK